MAILLNLKTTNPYARGYIVDMGDNKQILKRTQLEYNPIVSKDKSHTVRDQEKIWDLAYIYYGNSKLWYIIADANQLFNPFELVTNSKLLIPDQSNYKV
jgi:nucleoid-associated protein YgaU